MPDPRRVLALFSLIVGVIVLFAPVPDSVSYPFLGVLSGILSAIVYGIYLALSEQRFARFPSLEISKDVLWGTAFVFFVYTWFSGDFYAPSGKEAWLLLLALATISTVVPVVTLMGAIKLIGARDATMVSGLEPLIAVSLGAVFLGEHFGMQEALGSILLFSSTMIVALAIRSGR